MLRLFSLILLLAVVAPSWAQLPDSLAKQFAIGYAHYEKGDYEKALSAYQKAALPGYCSPELQNNLGLTYEKLEQYGPAVLAFERALFCQPQFAAAQANLKAIASKLSRPKAQEKAGFLFQTWDNIAAGLASHFWAYSFLFFLFLAAGSLAYYLFVQQKKGKTWLLILLSLLLAFFSFMLSRRANYLQFNRQWAVVMSPEAAILDQPSIQGKEVELVGSGNKALILEEKEDWYYVRLPNAVQGWISAKLLEKVRS